MRRGSDPPAGAKPRPAFVLVHSGDDITLAADLLRPAYAAHEAQAHLCLNPNLRLTLTYR